MTLENTRKETSITFSVSGAYKTKCSLTVSQARSIIDIDFCMIFSCNGATGKKLEFTVLNSEQADIFLDYVSTGGVSFFEVLKAI